MQDGSALLASASLPVYIPRCTLRGVRRHGAASQSMRTARRAGAVPVAVRGSKHCPRGCECCSGTCMQQSRFPAGQATWLAPRRRLINHSWLPAPVLQADSQWEALFGRPYDWEAHALTKAQAQALLQQLCQAGQLPQAQLPLASCLAEELLKHYQERLPGGKKAHAGNVVATAMVVLGQAGLGRPVTAKQAAAVVCGAGGQATGRSVFRHKAVASVLWKVGQLCCCFIFCWPCTIERKAAAQLLWAMGLVESAAGLLLGWVRRAAPLSPCAIEEGWLYDVDAGPMCGGVHTSLTSHTAWVPEYLILASL